MTQLTLRWKDENLDERLNQFAKEKDLSLNKAALQLLKQGSGIVESGRPTVGNALDNFIGSWSEDDEKDVLDAVKVFEEIDEELWK